MRFLILLIFFPFIISAQFFSSNNEIVYGINIGTYLANKNTAVIYDGFTNVSYGIQNILNNSNNINNGASNYLNQTLGNGNWFIGNIPPEMKYRPGLEVGLHVGSQNQKLKYYLDYNFAELKAIGQFNVIQDYNSSNSIEPLYETISVTGSERRSIFNFGIISDLVNEKDYHLGFPIFFQLIQTKFKSNQMIVNNQPYNISNPAQAQNNVLNNNQVGMGFGAGSGLILTVPLNTEINISFGYHLQYAKVKISEQVSGNGLQHSIFTRLIWTK
tara:strand:- start:152 stop:967 length:816 start_codon:yes stop_codon:yes gene_type:complete